MKSSAAVGLLLASSMSIFGVYAAQSHNANIPPGPEPVWVDGQMGVYDPDTGAFIPNTSPQFEETCARIRKRREDAINANANNSHWWSGSSSGYHPTHYVGSSSGYSSDSHASSSSTRGGFGSTGHSFGGGIS
jgi:hypothetical protein